MTTRGIHGHPVLIIGAGRGGFALLEMFLEDRLVTVVGVVDVSSEAPGIQLARQRNIPTFSDATEALEACRVYPDCIVYNLSHDDRIAAEAERIFGDKRVASGPEVKLFWQMVTNLKQVKGELEKSQLQLQSIIHNVMDGIITINETGEIHGFNPAAEQIFGYSQQEVLGRNAKILLPEAERNAKNTYLDWHVRSDETHMPGIRGREVRALRKDGTCFPMELSASEMVLGGQHYFIGIVRDITERKQAEQKISHLAHYDHLTDLPNRALFLDILNHSLALAKRNQQKAAVMFLDLDGFKQVNDTLGHDAGDLLLKGVAARIKSTLRDSDTVARVGGDEFILVLENIGSAHNAALVGSKILDALAPPFDLSNRPGHVGGSIGIALFPDDAGDPTDLVKEADEAMYLAKKSGKNNCKFYRDLAH